MMFQLVEVLERSPFLKRGHFELPDGRHSDQWFDSVGALESPAFVEPFLAELAEQLRLVGPGFVTGASSGGLIVASQVARILDARLLSLEFRSGGPEHVDPFAKLKGERVAVVDDFMTSAEQFDPTIRAVRKLGAEVVALGAMVAVPTRSAEVPIGPLCIACELAAQVFSAGQVPDWLMAIPVQEVPGWRSDSA
jgi:orotate phosphoribosyltransferase